MIFLTMSGSPTRDQYIQEKFSIILSPPRVYKTAYRASTVSGTITAVLHGSE